MQSSSSERFARLFPDRPVVRNFWSFGSPTLTEPDGEGVRLLLYTTGVEVEPDDLSPEAPAGRAMAVDASTNEVLWEVETTAELYARPRLVQKGGGGQDVLLAGRRGEFLRVEGRDGNLVWNADPREFAPIELDYNFYTPALVDDPEGLGRSLAVQIYGGDDTKLPLEARDPSWIALVDLDSGEVVASVRTPDRAESYMSPIAWPTGGQREAARDHVLIGTGGETHGGGLWLVPVLAILEGRVDEEARQAVAGGAKGVIAPPAVADLTGDGTFEILVTTFDGRFVVVDAELEELWTWSDSERELESYVTAAPLRMPDGERAVFVLFSVGVWPQYTGSTGVLLQGADGAVLRQQDWVFRYPTSPLAVDLHGSGADQLVFSLSQFPTTPGPRLPRTRVVVLDPASGESSFTEIDEAILGTGMVADANGDGWLEAIYVTSERVEAQTEEQRERYLNRLLRIDLNAERPGVITWGGYLGTAGDGWMQTP